MPHQLDEALLERALTAAEDKCIHIDSPQERNIAIRRASVEEGYHLAQAELLDLLQRCRSRVKGMQLIQGRQEDLGHTKLLAEIDDLLVLHASN
ncbi:TPA: hypothetical protein ACWLUJ_005762 [Pseudomonas aeruginosa]|nr:hypothetical protein [Pseudomonas aeruginosa]